MRIFLKNVLLAMLLIGASHCIAEDDDDATRSLAVNCDFWSGKGYQTELVRIDRAKDGSGAKAEIKHFEKAAKQESVTYRVKPGEVVECVFPSGNKVRAKVGEDEGRPYGMCGADPQVFVSVWVNERKIASREWFAGHCKQEDGGAEVSFRVFGSIYEKTSPSVEKCHSQPAKDDVNKQGSTVSGSTGLSVCVNYPEISRFPRDSLEYPQPKQKIRPVGDVILIDGSGPVCREALGELKTGFQVDVYEPESITKLAGPTWVDPEMKLPEELRSSRESIFDFDNDGNLDRVLLQANESTYMHGNMILVQKGLSPKTLKVSDDLLGEGSLYIPCQMDAESHKIKDCPGFSQKSDEAGVLIKYQGGKKGLYFRARYSTLRPFYFQGKSFFLIGSKSQDTEDFAAVMLPTTDKQFQAVCIFEKTKENF